MKRKVFFFSLLFLISFLNLAFSAKKDVSLPSHDKIYILAVPEAWFNRPPEFVLSRYDYLSQRDFFYKEAISAFKRAYPSLEVKRIDKMSQAQEGIPIVRVDLGRWRYSFIGTNTATDIVVRLFAEYYPSKESKGIPLGSFGNIQRAHVWLYDGYRDFNEDYLNAIRPALDKIVRAVGPLLTAHHK
ncbi:hypothetical protein IT6_02260 [Methylacidiphilum caldifontis]|uniref:hypothetical protein n=1 Tax=Methylacidiphilum caldifontis TaxID=2795386 RepID=UPI001A8C2267|nr:hypothetical protein [Methylacidiphilum caldifontis]QSR89132.1 hypothetical protein IT6_02260 [Methylacidiphilum caldifontis]